jgi:DNA (cytosine-5)-methyltransferase 1
MDKTRVELLQQCKDMNIQKCSSKTKQQLVDLICAKMGELQVCAKSTSPPSQPLNNETPNSFRFIDLFCGIGGFHQAMNKMDPNSNCVFACDIDEKCRETYEQNYGLKPHGDITKIDVNQIPPFDILCGGFPCQSFSKAGNQAGFDDKRGQLFFNICKIAENHRPKYMLLENVRNLSTHDDGNTWKVIYENIDKLGYYTYEIPVILNVLHFNVPQNRERVIIMCKRKDLGPLPILPTIHSSPKTTLTSAVKDIIDVGHNAIQLDGKMKIVSCIWDKFIKLLASSNINMPKFPIWTDWWDNDLNSDINFYNKYTNWIDKNREFFEDNKHVLCDWLTESRQNSSWLGAVRKFEWQAGDLDTTNDGMDKVLWTARGSGIRVKKPDYIPTLVAMSMVPVYGPENRKLTPRELLRLQSFPDTFEFNEKTILKQVGNAVNAKMIERCLRFLIFDENLFGV